MRAVCSPQDSCRRTLRDPDFLNSVRCVNPVEGLNGVSQRYPCPCCGYLVIDKPGTYDICPICLWEDDDVQLRWPDFPGGANDPSLIDAQLNYIRLGASEARVLPYVRPATADDVRDPLWRAVDVRIDNIERYEPDNDLWPDDYTKLYWWRPTYWRANESHRG